jgi:hypothetical protein
MHLASENNERGASAVKLLHSIMMTRDDEGKNQLLK